MTFIQKKCDENKTKLLWYGVLEARIRLYRTYLITCLFSVNRKMYKCNRTSALGA